MLHYLDDTCPGHSGSPVWVENPAAVGGRVMVGVHVARDDGLGTIANRAVAFTPAVLAQIRAWVAAAPGSGTRPMLRRGSSGPSVIELQTRLNAWRGTRAAAPFAPLLVDGVFGPRTDSAVRIFQRDNALAVDGVVGPITWGRLLSAPAGPVFESEFEFSSDALLRNICLSGGTMANRLRQAIQTAKARSPQHWQIAVDRIRKQGATWINRVSNQLSSQIGRLTKPELDRVIGCIARVEHAIGFETTPFRRLKEAAHRQMAQP